MIEEGKHESHTLEAYREDHRSDVDLHKEYILVAPFDRTSRLCGKKKKKKRLIKCAKLTPKITISSLCIPSISAQDSSNESITTSPGWVF